MAIPKDLTVSQWSMVPILTGMGMGIAATAAALAVALSVSLSNFPEVAYACRTAGMDVDQCQFGALKAGVYTVCAQIAGLVVVAVAFWRANAQPGRPRSGCHVLPEFSRSLVVVALAVCIAHIVFESVLGSTGSRVEDIRRFSLFVSLENLLWPMLVQIYVVKKKSRLEAVAQFAALMTLVQLSPYRAVGLAVFTFAFLLPILADIWQRNFLENRVAFTRAVALAALVLVSVSVNTYVDSVNRIPGIPGTASSSPAPAASNLRPVQRLVYPLYQAAIVEHLVDREDTPGLSAEIMKKFRISDNLTINELVYKRIYAGSGTGQITPLIYGEAISYFSDFPLIWLFVAPSLCFMFWYTVLKERVPSSSLVGIAIWRSSFSGVITVLPALLLQIIAFAFFAQSRQKLTRLKRWFGLFLRPLIPTVLSAGLVIQLWSLIFENRDRLVVSIAAAPGCSFPDGEVLNEIKRVTATDMNLTWENTGAILILSVPDHPQSLIQFKAAIDGIERKVVCTSLATNGAVSVLSERKVIRPVSFLQLLATTALGLSLFVWLGRPKRVITKWLSS